MAAQSEQVFGIDLGTTNSCIAYVDESGIPTVVSNAEGDQTTPSVVFFDGDSRVVGVEAKNIAVLYPDQVAEMVKRQMGVAGWSFFCSGTAYSVEEISSYILRKAVGDAEASTGQKITDVVITCPAYFGISERDATAKAGEIAGLHVLSIINEPTAAAISYGLHEDRDQVVLIYDLGGGTFDVTLIEIKGGSLTVIATGGNHRLGGRNWDEIVVSYLAERWQAETGSSDQPMDSPETLQDLFAKAEAGKRALTARQETTIAVVHNGQRAAIKLSREKFDELTANLIEQTIQHTRGVLDEAAARGVKGFDQFLLVGGSTKMPQVRDRLTREFSTEPKIHDPDLSVAKGAAIFGRKLAIGKQIDIRLQELSGGRDGEAARAAATPELLERARRDVAAGLGLALPAVREFDQLRITNVTSRSFGVIALQAENGRQVEKVVNLIQANDQLPAGATQQFGTVEANQTNAEIQIAENISHDQLVDPAKCEIIGNAVLPLPPGLPAGSPVEINFQFDEQGRLHATARELSTNKIIEVSIETNRAISAEELEAVKSRATRLVIS